MILYVEGLHTHTHTQLQDLINQFRKVAEYTVNTQKPVALL